MKKSKKIISASSILLPIALILNIYCSVPSKINVTQNDEYSLKLNKLLGIASETAQASSESGAIYRLSNDEITLNTDNCGEYSLPVKLLNVPFKTISVTISPEKYVFPSGDSIGVKLYTEGVLVVNISEFPSADGHLVSPARLAGLETGDRIIAVNNNPINTVEELSEYISAENPLLELTVMRYASRFNVSVTAEKTENSDNVRLGIWVRDSTAGIGTLTFYDPDTSAFAALGHAICDPDTGDVMKLRKGSILSCRISSSVKGKAGVPGELVGSFGEHTLGTIKDNNELGIYGKLEDKQYFSVSEPVGIAARYQIKEGAAKILSNVDGEGVKEYSVEIVKVSKAAKTGNKGLVLKVTDENLIEKTGGIVQGMSGSPIIQNGLLIGAVTHVFVNDPTKGYGIFIENMLSEAEKIG